MDIITAALAASMSGGGGGGTGTDDYNELSNKPKINNVTLAGNKSLSDIGAAAADETYTDAEVDTLLAGKVDKVDGKGLSTEDFTAAEKSKLAGIAAGAEVNVQANWAQTSSSADDFIKNKPTLGAAASKGVDSTPTASSTNLVTSGGVATALAAKLNTADVDDALSSTSTNPVQNRVVQAPIARLVDAGSKNVLNLNTTFTSHVNKGITYTNNNDGTVKVSGTSNASDSYITIYDMDVDNLFGFSKGRTVVLVSTSDDVSINIVPKKEGGGYGLTAYGYKSSPATFTIPSDFSGFLLRVAVPRSGTTVSENVSGMLCAVEDYSISPEFVPYAPSNRELYKMILALQNAQNGG